MAEQLIRVVRRDQRRLDFMVQGVRHTMGYVIAHDEYDRDGLPDAEGSFFLVDNSRPEEFTMYVRRLAEANPGCEVQVYGELVSSGVCPAAEFVMKSVTKDGVLPAAAPVVVVDNAPAAIAQQPAPARFAAGGRWGLDRAAALMAEDELARRALMDEAEDRAEPPQW